MRCELLVVLLGLSVNASAAPATKPVPPTVKQAVPPMPMPPPQTLLPGVLVDPASKLVFVMRETATLEAVTFAGKSKWTAKKAEKPLWIAGALLLAQAGQSLVVLDASSGKLKKTCTPAAGTTWQPPAITAGLNNSSTMIATDAGADKALLSWSHETHYAGGAAPSPEMTAAAASAAGGAVEVDLAGCTFKELSSWTSPKPKPGQPLQPPAPSGTSTTPTTVNAGTLHGPVAVPAPPSIVDGVAIEVATDISGDKQRVILRRKSAGKPLPDVEVATGKAPYVHAMVSADGRYAIAVAQDPTSGGASGIFYYDHTIFDAVQGTKVAAFRTSWHAGRVVVVGDTILDATSYVVHAVDTKAGKERWSRKLRLTFYNGPMPP